MTVPPAASIRAKRAERVALGLERRLHRRARSDRHDPALPAGDDRGLRVGRVVRTRSRPTSPCSAPRRTPPAMVTTSRAPRMSRPGRRLGAPAALDDPERTAAHDGGRRRGPPRAGAPGPARDGSHAAAGSARPRRAGVSTGSSPGRPAWSATASSAASGARPMSSDSASVDAVLGGQLPDALPDQPQRRHARSRAGSSTPGPAPDAHAPARGSRSRWPAPAAARRPTRGPAGRSAWPARRPRRRG